MELSLAQVEEVTGSRLILPAMTDAGLMALRAARVTGWSIDSRTVNRGDLFFAIKGPRLRRASFRPGNV